ncbi:MAG: D-alanine--D-alanine ligase [Flavobacteriaceae bacterium]|nr:D-alanine--D-alanine ligase [Flavobacteriaceae bacterium]
MKKSVIGILCGGFSSEKEISFKSGLNVLNNLSEKLWASYLIKFNNNKWYVEDKEEKKYTFFINDFSFNKNDLKIKFDVIFNAIHGPPGENGQIISFIELINIPYTGSNSYSSALTYNKRDCLSILKNYGINSSKNYYLDQDQKINEDEIVKSVGLPCFVKANRSGSSFGIYKVYKKTELAISIKKAFKEDSQLIIEKALKGREFSVGVYRLNNEIKVLPITEIISENDFFDYSAKYEGKSEEITPAKLDYKNIKRLKELSIRIFKILNLRGFTRSEFIIENNIPYLLDINTVPGLTKESILPKQLLAANISLESFFNDLLNEALNKKP